MNITQVSNGVRVDSSSTTSVLIERRFDCLFVRASFTPSGWFLILILMLLGWISVIATALLILSFKRGLAFVEADRFIELWRSKPESTGESGGRFGIMDLLYKSEIVVKEATAARRSNMKNIIYGGICFGVIGMVYVWISSYQAMGVGIEANFMRSLAYGIFAGLVIASPVMIGAIIRFHPQISGLETWRKRIDLMMQKEKTGLASNDSPMELLLSITEQLPIWNDYRARAGYLFDQGSWISIGVLMMLGVSITLYGNVQIGGILLIVAIIIYYQWQRKNKNDQKKMMDSWSSSIQILQAQLMDES